MTSFYGNLLLWCALFCSMIQGLLPLWGFYRKEPHALAFARPSSFAQCFFVISTFILLMIAFVNNDFSIAYVAANSHPSLPFMYRLTAVWGAHEGSILLWIVILNLWTVAFSIFEKNYSGMPVVLAILGLISFCFLCFLLLTSNPFLATTTFVTAKDLNPLLQDPGFVTHPPMLYTGYVGFSAAFAITQAALIMNKLDKEWARITRWFAIAAWSFLTLGITLGSWWAYRVLGWGGFWFWDPVENASLLPWLSGTALIHILMLTEKRQIFIAWSILLSLITFVLSVLGTFLVRSGVLISAHTFANDPARGVFLLLLLAILSVAALILYLARVLKLPSSPTFKFQVFTRETGLLVNSTLLFIAMLIVLLGTLYPLIIDVLHLGAISVGAPYFNKVMLPFVCIILFFMGFMPFCHWQQEIINWRQVLKKLSLSFILAFSLLFIFTEQINIIAAFCLSLCFWVLSSTLPLLRSRFAASLAHLGFAILIIGIVLSTSLNEEREVRIRPGNSVTIGPYQFFFLSADRADGSNYLAVRAHFEIIKNKRYIAYLYPEKRRYTVRDMVITKVDIHPSLFRDLYIALGEPLEQGYWSVRIYYKPFIRWIWVGGLIMMLGGMLTIIPKLVRRERVIYR